MFKEFIQNLSPKNRVLKDIYLLIKQYGPISKAQLLQKINLKQTTLSDKMEELLQKKYIREGGLGESSGGRPPVLYQIEPRCGYMIGIFISRLEIKIALNDLLLNTIEQKKFLMNIDQPNIIISRIKDIIYSLLEKYQISLDRLLGIGIGTIGPLDKEKGIIGSSLGDEWRDIPIIQIMEEDFPVRIVLENSVNATILAENNFLNPPSENILYCYSGIGLGCGVISNGELLQTKTGYLNKYGHIVVDVNGKQCSCGKRGCLVSYTSPYSIMEEILENSPGSFEFQKTNMEEVITFLKQDIPIIKSCIMESAYYLGVGIANFINLFESELVILDGILIDEYPGYYEEVISYAIKFADNKKIQFSRVKLGDQAATIGAALLVSNSYFQSL